MNKKVGLIVAGVIVILLLVTGFVVYKAVFSGSPSPTQTTEAITPADLPAIDSSVQVNLTKSTTVANTVVISVKGLAGKFSTLEYDLQYMTNNIGQGVTSSPIDLKGQDTLSRDIYLGTCSKNVCTPHTGVTSVTLNLVLTDTLGKKSQFSKDYTL